VVNDQNIVEYRPIKTGPEEPGGMQVVMPEKIVRKEGKPRPAEANEQGEESLTPSDRVVVSRLQTIGQGAKVLPKPED
jgi:hypothetical protein